MSLVVASLRSWLQPRAVALTVIAISAAGCSSETTRFSDSPFDSRTAGPEVTGSVPPAQAAPIARVQSATLPPPAAPAVTRPTTVAAGSGVSGGGRGMASYQPASMAANADITGSVQAPAASTGHWTWDGGTAVTVGQGDTVSGIAHRHGVPATAIMQANNLSPGQAIYPGQRLVIPRYGSAATPAAAAPPAAAPVTRPTASSPRKPATPAVGALSGAPGPNGVHVVAPGDTLSKISRRYGKSISDIARANNIEPHATLKIGGKITIPGVRTSKAKGKDATKVAQAKPLASQAPAKTAAGKSPATKQASAEPAQSASVVTPAAETPAVTHSAKKSAEASAPTFRWPAKGRVVAGFGPKTNGQQNDGINLAVPEGTPVKASEDGVVAYSGNELKGYGNLVLVRHSNGYVTAYAHAKELLVKRGDQVKRGQVIAKSGQTGNVDGPQLHFEIRKGPAPVDPLPMLSGG